ncbi:MAG: hypothetical protein M3Z02_07115 [Actinomycetota bacterium]|nr:hypothetical protein [Actinomycetota bacterium]
MLTLETVQRATNTASARAFVEDRLAGTGWTLARIRRTWVRLQPPKAYWATYKVRAERAASAGKGGQAREPERRELTLVIRACFDSEDWRAYRSWLTELYGEADCDPIKGLGYPVLVDESQHARWFYPVDPTLPTLADANDSRLVSKLLTPRRYSAKTPRPRIRVELLRYVPEVSAAIRYHIVDRPGAAERVVYGKVYRGGMGLALHTAMQQLWQLSQERPDLLTVPRPVAYDHDLRLHLEEAVAGVPVDSDRTEPRFLAAALAAADALAVMHDSSAIDTEEELPIVPEIDRLAQVAEQLALVHPPAHALMLALVKQLRSRLAKVPAEELVVTHGDMKYDQFLDDNGRFGLVDFAELGRSETSWDLGKWCGHAVPSMPETWEESFGAEEARLAFLARYRELRPHATMQRFALYESVHLANRAMVLMWGQVTNWEEAAESLLALAMERLRSPLPV